MGNGVRGLLLRGYEVDVMRSGGLSNGMPSDSDPAVYLSPPTLRERGGDELSLCRRRHRLSLSRLQLVNQIAGLLPLVGFGVLLIGEIVAKRAGSLERRLLPRAVEREFADADALFQAVGKFHHGILAELRDEIGQRGEQRGIGHLLVRHAAPRPGLKLPGSAIMPCRWNFAASSPSNKCMISPFRPRIPRIGRRVLQWQRALARARPIQRAYHAKGPRKGARLVHSKHWIDAGSAWSKEPTARACRRSSRLRQ